MECPRDGTPLATQTYEADIQVDRCPQCRGLWLDRGELERVQETIERDYAAVLKNVNTVAQAYELARQKKRPGVACPRCRQPLATKEYGYCSQIPIDLCPHCGGIWLDEGEVQALEQFFERERLAAREEAEAAKVRKGYWASLGSLFRNAKD